MEIQKKLAASASSVIVLDEPRIIGPIQGRLTHPFTFQDLENNPLPPQVIGQIDSPRDFSAPLPYTADDRGLVQASLCIKAPGTKFYIPRELEGHLEFIQKSINHHYSSGRRTFQEHCLLDIRQASFIAPGAGDNVHIDAHYGDMRAGLFHDASVYIASDKAPTIFFEGPFSIREEYLDYPNYSEAMYEVIRTQFQQQSLTKKRIQFDPYSITFFNSTDAHQGLATDNMGVRTVGILRFQPYSRTSPERFNNQALADAVKAQEKLINNPQKVRYDIR